jgi:hypothetical protein
MEKERLKLIVRNLELLVDSLKAEVYSDADAYMRSDGELKEYYNKYGHPNDYDEVFEDDDG